jgi:hypothetical protein
VTEGETTHVSIEEIKAHDKYTEDDKICCAVNAQDRKDNEKTCSNNEELKNAFLP